VPQPRSLRTFRRGARAMGLRAPASCTGRPGTPSRVWLRVRAYGTPSACGRSRAGLRQPGFARVALAYAPSAAAPRLPAAARSATALRQSAYGAALGPHAPAVCLRFRAQPARSVVPGLSRFTRFARYGPRHLRPAAPRPPLPRLWLGPRRRPARGVVGRNPAGPATTDETRSRSRPREADSGDTLRGARAPVRACGPTPARASPSAPESPRPRRPRTTCAGTPPAA
jgi:hypothetical protein